MADFTVGEEVMFDEERYVVAGISDEKPKRYRLLATSKEGAKFVWVDESELEPMNSYLNPNDDTAKY